MAFRKSVPQEDLRGTMSEERMEHDATDYQASRGGWLKTEEKPIPGTPQTED